VQINNRLVKKKPHEENQNKNLSYYISKVARLGGYLARKSDPPPGNIVMWRGFSRLTDIAMGFSLADKMTYG
jgi:hypothetical protein